jgi:ketosteroid isomerase-like protein
MPEQENTAAVQGLYESFKTGDMDAMIAGMANDVAWDLPEIAAISFSGKRNGHDSVRGFFAAIGENQDVEEMEVNKMIAKGDIVVVLGHYAWRVKATGRSFSSDFAHVFHLASGKITRFQEFLDTAAAAAAY